jgi:hypothetical protein
MTCHHFNILVVNDEASRTAALGYLLVYGTTCSCEAILPVDLSNK